MTRVQKAWRFGAIAFSTLAIGAFSGVQSAKAAIVVVTLVPTSTSSADQNVAFSVTAPPENAPITPQYLGANYTTPSPVAGNWVTSAAANAYTIYKYSAPAVCAAATISSIRLVVTSNASTDSSTHVKAALFLGGVGQTVTTLTSGARMSESLFSPTAMNWLALGAGFSVGNNPGTINATYALSTTVGAIGTLSVPVIHDANGIGKTTTISTTAPTLEITYDDALCSVTTTPTTAAPTTAAPTTAPGVTTTAPPTTAPGVTTTGAPTTSAGATTTAPGTTTTAPGTTTSVLGSLGDKVFDDANKNGIQDSGEVGVPGIRVILRDASCLNEVKRTVTDSAGMYLFSGLTLGTYCVEFDVTTLPAGTILTTPNVGSNDAVDSDASVNTGKTGVYVLTQSSPNDLTVDAGIVRTTVSVPGGLVGSASFSTVATTAPAAAAATAAPTTAAPATTTAVPTTTTAPGTPCTGEVAATVYVDANRNGVQDVGEAPLAGVTVKLTPASGSAVSATTDAQGNYSFTKVPCGTATVSVDGAGIDPALEFVTGQSISVNVAGGSANRPVAVFAVAAKNIPAITAANSNKLTLAAIALLAGGMSLAIAGRRRSSTPRPIHR